METNAMAKCPFCAKQVQNYSMHVIHCEREWKKKYNDKINSQPNQQQQHRQSAQQYNPFTFQEDHEYIPRNQRDRNSQRQNEQFEQIQRQRIDHPYQNRFNVIPDYLPTYARNSSSRSNNNNQQNNNQHNEEGFEAIECPNCQSRLNIMQLEMHIETCPAREVKCQYCQNEYPYCLLDKHLDVCEAQIESHRQQSNLRRSNIFQHINQQPHRQPQLIQQSQQQPPRQQQQQQQQQRIHGSNRNGPSYERIDQELIEDSQARSPNRRNQQQQQQQQQQQRISFGSQRQAQQQQQQEQSSNQARSNRTERIPDPFEFDNEDIPENPNFGQVRNIFEQLMFAFGDQRSSGNRNVIFRTNLVHQDPRMMRQGRQHNLINHIMQMLHHGGGRHIDHSNNGGLNEKQMKDFPVHEFKKLPNMNEDQCSCTICMCDFEEKEKIKILDCMHSYHSDCIDLWLKKNTTCPVCKKDMKEFVG